MTSSTSPQTSTQGSPSDVIAMVADRLGRDQVFGPPVESAGTTLVPGARVRARGGFGGRRAAGGGSGAGGEARPVGAFAIRPDGKVAWHPAVDVNRIVLGGQVAVAVVLAVTLARRRRRRSAR